MHEEWHQATFVVFVPGRAGCQRAVGLQRTRLEVLQRDVDQTIERAEVDRQHAGLELGPR